MSLTKAKLKLWQIIIKLRIFYLLEWNRWGLCRSLWVLRRNRNWKESSVLSWCQAGWTGVLEIRAHKGLITWSMWSSRLNSYSVGLKLSHTGPAQFYNFFRNNMPNCKEKCEGKKHIFFIPIKIFMMELNKKLELNKKYFNPGKRPAI